MPVPHPTYYDKVASYAPTVYWPLNELSGAVALEHMREWDGAYTGVALDQPGIGDGASCPFFDGTSDVANIYSVAFRDAFDGAEGTAIVWARVADAGVWTDGVERRILTLFVNSSNYVAIQSSNLDDLLVLRQVAGGTVKTVTRATTRLSWFAVALTWSKTADQLKAFFNGVQVGETQTGLDVWAGDLSATGACIGAIHTGPAGVWDGWLAHPAIWCGTVLASAQIEDLAIRYMPSRDLAGR